MAKKKQNLTEALKKYFGFDKFKGDQEAIIQNVLNGKDTKPDEWAASEMREAVDLGITDGTRSKGYATRQEAAIMVLRAFKGGAAKAVKDAALALLEKIKGVL